MKVSSDHLVDLLTCAICVVLAFAAQQYYSLQREIDDYRLSDLNNTGRSDHDQEGLIFNRVPKVGSEMIWALIDQLAKVNQFNSFSDSMDVKNQRGGENNFMPQKATRENYVKILQENCTKPFSYVKHLNFLDLGEFGLPNPIYINFVRHPVDRVISWYYYKRTPWHLIKQKDNRTEMNSRVPPILELKQTFEECVLNKYHECVFRPGQGVFSSHFGGAHYSQIGFYCGHDMDCDEFGGRKGLNRAMQNVERHFAVVGVLEELDKSLEILENYVPRFFRDARKVHKSMHKAFQEKNKNIYKPKTPGYIKDVLMANFSVEIEFYEFCKQRLERQYLAMQ